MIVTIGEAMMVFNGPVGEPIALGTPLRATFAGAESNVAIGLARLGHGVRYLSVLGDDLFGHVIATRLREEGVDVSGVRFSTEHPTGVMFKNRSVGEEPEVSYYRNTSAFAQCGGEAFDAEQWRDATLIYLTGITPALSAGCLGLVRRVLEDAAERRIPVWLDPNYRRKLWGAEAYRETLTGMLPLVETVLPGVAEGTLLTGKSEVGEIACTLIGMGAKNVIVKDGGRGAAAYMKEGTAHVAAFAVERMIDPIGGGEGFAAGYLSGHREGLGIEECLRRGHAVGAMVCGTEGDWEGLPDRGKLEQFLLRAAER
jgi:2-dehydro-3-deoxygluconokinase